MQKKAQSGTLAIWLVLVVLIVFAGFFSYFTWFQPEVAGEEVPEGKEGDLGSLKYSVRTISDATSAQFAGTGYCWNTAEPTKLIESSSGKTLSASAGTSFANAFRGKSYTCDSFTSSHFCKPDAGIMGDEGLNLRSDCQNLTASSEIDLTFYENDVAETTNSLTVITGGAKSYNKMLIEVNKSYKAVPIKALCFKSNLTTSHIQTLEVAGMTLDANPSGSYTWCYSLAEPTVVDRNAGYSKILNNPITIYSDSTGFGTEEEVTVTVMDAGKYVTTAGAVKEDYFARDTNSRADVGMTNPTFTFDLYD